jgi:hypothetical protein
LLGVNDPAPAVVAESQYANIDVADTHYSSQDKSNKSSDNYLDLVFFIFF